MVFLESFFETSVAKAPKAIAVETEENKVTYRTLDKRANQIAHYLVEGGVEPNDRICIFTGKNEHAYAALLGTLKAGACWVPIGFGQPRERLCKLVQKIDPKFIIADDMTLFEACKLRDTCDDVLPILILNSDQSNSSKHIGSDSDLGAYSSEKPVIQGRSEDDLAYIIFTSGSTGMPKGVMVLHRNIVQFLGLCHDFFNVDEGSRFAHHSDLTFDPSLFDLFYGWSRIGTVIPFDRPSYRINPTLFLKKFKINIWFSVPSAISGIVESGGLEEEAIQSIKHLLLTGEVIQGNLVRQWYDANPTIKIYNVYGTTETAIISHWYLIPRDFDPDKPVPVGSLLPGFRTYLMSGNDLVPPGGVGECLDYSAQISPGYWADEEETIARFVRNPLDPRMPQVWYRSGDLLRLRTDGLYEYLGRVDNQVKIRGHRIELGEVENTLEKHPLVAEAAVIKGGSKDRPNEARLIAYIAGREGATEKKLRLYLEEHLPRYMIPLNFIIGNLPLPRNNNGKIDRASLSEREEAISGKI